MKKGQSKPQHKSKSTLHKSERIIQVVEPLEPDAIARQLISFNVTVDSVVATATIVFDDSHTHLLLNWGDDQVESINLFKLRMLSKTASTVQDPNTLRIQHVYKAPFDDGSRYISAITRDSSNRTSTDSAFVTIEKRYKLNFYSVILEFPHHLDSIFESHSEINSRLFAKQGDDKFFDKSWQNDVLTAPSITTGEPITLLLNKSHFSREISMSDEPVKIYFEMVEADGIGEEGGVLNTIWDILTSPKYIFDLVPISTNPAYDDYNLPNLIEEHPFKLHPDYSLNSNVANGIYRMPIDHGVVFVKYNFEMRLIIPLDQEENKLMTAS